MRRALFLIPALFVLVAGAAVVWWRTAAEQPPEQIPDVMFRDLDLSEPWVHTAGMAHYAVVVEQTVPASLVTKAHTTWLFPLFEAHDTESREIRVLVRTDRRPEDLVSFELMRVTGHLSLPTHDKVPFDTEIIFGKRSNYYFSDQMLLLEATDIQSGFGGADE